MGMKWALNLSIILLALCFIFSILGSVGFTGAVIGTEKISNLIYPLTIIVMAASLILLLSFRRWATAGLAALTLGGSVVGKRFYDNSRQEIANQETARHAQVEEALDYVRAEITDANLYARGGSKDQKYGPSPIKGTPKLAANMYLDALERTSSIVTLTPREEKDKRSCIEEIEEGLRNTLKLPKMDLPHVNTDPVGP